MTEKSFIFRVSTYDADALLSQVSKALEKRTELLSREQYPGLWKGIDKVNAIPKRDHRRSPLWKLVYVLCIAAGIFLFIPGLMKPQELTVPLVVGALAILCGIWRLWGSRKNKAPKTTDKRFDEAAKQLLAGKDAIPEEEALTVTFSEAGMYISANSSSAEPVPYSGFETVIETADAILLVYGELVTLLQKKDLADGDVFEFCTFLSEQVAVYQTVK